MYKTKLNVVELESGDFHTLVRGSVAGQRIRIVLDTGASHSCMDAAYAQSILPQPPTAPHDVLTAAIGGDDFTVRIADVPDFRLGRFHLPCYQNMALLDFTYVNAAYKKLRRKPIQMILGNDFFVSHKAVINYQDNYLFFE
jgi:hypothetical protein